MASYWKYQHDEDTIEVNNSLSAASLTINGKECDKVRGIALSALLTGTLSSGEQVKARLGGTFTIKCDLWVNDELQEPVEIK